MDFSLSEEQQMFAETARQLFADKSGADQWREQMRSGEARIEARWSAIAENGFTTLLLPENEGGLGLSELDFALVAEQAGYAALPDPLVESAGVAAPMLAQLAPGHDLLARPDASIAIQHPANAAVADADISAAIILHDAGTAYLARPDQVGLSRRESIDPFRRLFNVEWDKQQATELGRADWDLALDRGALFAAAQGLGIAQRCVDLAVAYAKERQQFGKPIGTYQAVKHHLASAQTAIEFVRPVVLAAAARIGDRDLVAQSLISHAKIVALEAADNAARAAIQVHGAMGYSWEVDVHLFLKRSLALTNSWGTPYFHRQRIAKRMATCPIGPSHTFDREPQNA